MYAKIFSQILDSSIVENPEVRFTFMDLLVLCDKDGVVDMTHEAIARRTNRPIEVIRSTIKALEEPDQRSRTPTHDGRRIVRLDDHRDWGWLIINYTKFSKIRTAEDRRAYKTGWQAKKRAEKNCGHIVDTCGQSVDSCGQMRTMLTNADVDADIDIRDEVKHNNAPPASPQYTLEHFKDIARRICLQETEAEKCFNHYASQGWVKKNGLKIVDIQPLLASWKSRMLNDAGESKAKKASSLPPGLRRSDSQKGVA